MPFWQNGQLKVFLSGDKAWAGKSISRANLRRVYL